MQPGHRETSPKDPLDSDVQISSFCASPASCSLHFLIFPNTNLKLSSALLRRRVRKVLLGTLVGLAGQFRKRREEEKLPLIFSLGFTTSPLRLLVLTAQAGVHFPGKWRGLALSCLLCPRTLDCHGQNYPFPTEKSRRAYTEQNQTKKIWIYIGCIPPFFPLKTFGRVFFFFFKVMEAVFKCPLQKNVKQKSIQQKVNITPNSIIDIKSLPLTTFGIEVLAFLKMYV